MTDSDSEQDDELVIDIPQIKDKIIRLIKVAYLNILDLL